MKNLYLSSLLFLTSLGVNAQTCGTRPLDSIHFVKQRWFGDNSILHELHDSVSQIALSQRMSKKTSSNYYGGFSTETVYWVPVKAFIFRDNVGSGGVTQRQVEENIRYTNALLRQGFRTSYFNTEPNNPVSSPSYIQLYSKCHIQEIWDNDGLNIAANRDDFIDIINNNGNFHYGAINIYYANSIANAGGFAWVPHDDLDKDLAYRIAMVGAPRNSTLAHELGHALGLSHTHNRFGSSDPNGDNYFAGNCEQERVNRSYPACFPFNGFTTAEVYGDGIDDTQADAKLIPNGDIGNDGSYSGSLTDQSSQTFIPPAFNIMSYHRDQLTVEFTSNQLGVMHSILLSSPVSGFDLHYSNEFVDLFEPDDNKGKFRTHGNRDPMTLYNELIPGIKQHRGLHRAINGNRGATNTYSYCDADWAWFDVQRPGKYRVLLEGVPGSSNFPNANLEVFDDSDNLMYVNSDFQNSNSQFFQKGTYWVKVSSNGNSRGEYLLSLEDCAAECCFNDLIGSAATISSTTGPFNLGTRATGVEEYLGNNLTVTDNLYFNNSSPLGFGGSGNPISSSHLEAIICNNAEIVIDNGGEMALGHVAANQTAEVLFQAGTTLRIKDGGKLTIRDGSNLVIEDGANFIFEDGAQVELAGYYTTITFKGKFTIGDNADFTVSGLGKLIFDQDVKWGLNGSGNYYLQLDEYWDIGSNTTFTMEGPSTINENHNLIEAYKPVYFKTEDGSTFDQVTIQYGRVAFHQDALLFSFSPTTLRWVKFEAAYSWQTHGGFRLWNNPGPNTIWSCKFYDGKPAALMHWVGGGNPITFTNCDFDNNETGLEVQGGNFKLNNCDFNDNYQAVYAVNLTGQSFINGSKFIGSNNAFHDGAFIHAQNGASLTVNSSEFSNCIDGLSLGADMSARVYCSEFTLNGRYGILAATSSSLDIGSEAENVFTGNQWDDIYLTGDHEKSAVYMDEGRNDFAARGYQGGSYLQGRFSNGMPVFLGGTNQIPANNNKMPTYISGGQTYMPVDFTYKLTPGGTTTNVTLNIPSNLSSIQRECTGGIFDDPGHTGHYRLVQSFPGGGGIINNPDYPDTELKEAALEAIDMVSFGEDIRDDAGALVQLTGILDAAVSDPDAYTERIRSAVYQQMHQALSNAYQNGGLVNVQGEDPNGINDTVDDVITVIDQFITDIDPNDATLHFLDFKYHLDKAHVYRVSGYYDEALAVLQTSQNWTHDYDQTQQAGYWECVCEAENAYYNDELPEEEYAHQIESCNQEFYGNNYKRGEVNSTENNAYAIDPTVDLNQITLYPQPATNEVTLEITNAFDGEVSFTVSDVSGKVVKKGDWHWTGTSQSVNVSNLTTGVYFIRLQFGNQPDKAIKFIKE